MLRTDLALEAKEMYHEKVGDTTEIEGVVADSKEIDGVIVTHVEILNEKGSNNIGKPVGNYYTLEIPEFKEIGYAYYHLVSELLSEYLKKILPCMQGKTALVVGLGNRHITSDALGPFAVDKLIVTRHLFELAPKSVGALGSLCAVSPGVLGGTGIETAEIIKGVCDKIKPDAVIVIDALASRKTERVATTIQMSDTGINPGSGIGNHRKEITKRYLGAPVVSIGVPMVVDSLTIAYDAIDEIGMIEKTEILNKIGKKKQDENALFIVTPKDIDKLTTQMANIISSAINITLHNIKIEEIDSYLG
ncbi:MAG: GPR endopeptidase [Clostridia bacterium]|nr:GPR endopeptidase [Clostridia bacterium]